MTTLLLVRHGETDWNAEGRLQGHTDRPLNERGRRQAQRLAERLHRVALDCWALFRLDGYARVDFRVDERGRPWVLEVNANPCLSPDAGFAAALAEAGIGYEAAVARLVDDALERAPRARRASA